MGSQVNEVSGNGDRIVVIYVQRMDFRLQAPKMSCRRLRNYQLETQCATSQHGSGYGPGSQAQFQ